jgi:hypothetical protein
MTAALENRVRASFLEQAEACRDLGSPFTARLCALAGKRLNTAQGEVAARILSWPDEPGAAGDAVALRFAGALHGLVLDGRAAALTKVYPPHDGMIDDDALWTAMREACRDQAAVILAWLTSPPQTNEVRRSAIIYAGLSQVAELFGLPLVLSELGASAGLNLKLDCYRYRLSGRELGDPRSPVPLSPSWEGAPPSKAEVRIAARAGCDLNPLDPARPADRLRILSYLWADQADRLALTRAALTLAARHPPRVARSDAVAWLEERLGAPHHGHVHVICHTIAWQYFPEDSKRRGEALLHEAGRLANPERPLAWLRFEGDGTGPGAALTLTAWPEGEEKVIARADYHGRWIRWTGW